MAIGSIYINYINDKKIILYVLILLSCILNISTEFNNKILFSTKDNIIIPQKLFTKKKALQRILKFIHFIARTVIKIK